MSNILKDEKKLDLVLERFYNRYNKYNEKVLKVLGETVKEIGDMKPSEVHQLSQQIKYSEDINKLIQELADITDLSSQDVETLFEKFAKENVEFAEAYYEAKDKEYKNYDDNIRLKRMVESIKHNTNSTMVNLSNASAIGFVYKDNFGNKSFKGLQKTYYDLVDEAVYQVATGTVDYGKAMRNVLNGLADSGIRTHEDKIGYKSGYSRRLDSAIRQNILDGLRSVNIDIQSQIGDEIGADGIEITAHTLCAPDHIPYQGRQYTKEEFEKINDYELDRPIATGMYNCRHFAMQVVLGVDEPMYSKEDLKRFEEESFSKVKYNGKTYTKYEATQIQRKLETAIRKQKDRQIVAKASGDTEGIRIAQQKISQLANEYNKFSNAVSLKTYKNRLTVSGYKRVKVSENLIENISDKLNKHNIVVNENVYDKSINKELIDKSLKQVDKLVNKYPVLENKIKKDGLSIEVNNDIYAGTTSVIGDKIRLSKGLYEDKNKLISKIKEGQDDNWSAKVNKNNYDIYTITHETGHILEDAIISERVKAKEGYDIAELMTNNQYQATRFKRQEDVDIFNEIFLHASDETGISWKDLEKKYISDYGKSEQNYEWFAELFTKMELGKKDIMTEKLREYLEGELWKK